MTTKTLPPLTASDFDMRWDADRVFPFVESEDALIMAHGHQDRAEFTKTVHDYDVLCVGAEAEKHSESDVQHLWAVHIDRGDGDQDGWWMSWRGVTSETPNAFPITIIQR